MSNTVKVIKAKYVCNECTIKFEGSPGYIRCPNNPEHHYITWVNYKQLKESGEFTDVKSS
jgi:hypothetical protein